MTKRLQGRVSLVTGASKGIGRAIALALGKEGADVVVTARGKSQLEGLVEELEALGVRALAVSADARRQEDVERLKENILATFGSVDMLINNVGVGKYGPFDTFTAEDYDWLMDTNMRSSFLCTKAFLPAMLEHERGWIVFVASVSGLLGLPQEAVYCASKHAQVGFAKALDHEVRQYGVKVTVIAPGAVKTEHAFGTGRTPGDPRHEQFLEADDVAQAVVFAVTQPPKSRVFLIGMRPMSESLFD